MDVARVLEQGRLRIADILNDEAKFLCESSPIPSSPKRSTASRSHLTELAKKGQGLAYCILRKWPVESTPLEWGRRNEAVLLHQVIQSNIWTQLSPGYNSIKRRLQTTQLLSMRADDNGNEEEYKHTIESLMDRIFAAAFLFYLNEWLKSENSEHPDRPVALNALKSFSVKAEHTYSDGTIRNNVGIIIPNSDMLRKKLPKPQRLVCLSNLNVKNTGQSQWDYTSVTSSKLPEVHTMDEVMDVSLKIAETENITIQVLQETLVQEYQLKKLNLEWPLFAVSHFTQMPYESSISTSSLGTFTSLWGFHQFCFREERLGDIPILYVSDNLTHDFTTPEHRTDEDLNQSIVTQFYFMAILTIEFSFVGITPSNLRHDKFGSHIHKG